MKKVERINVMMRYINNRAHFTLSELMREFDISRSTASRDVREIEAMGMPLVAEVGRDGGYFVMKNAVLPPVRFTDNEVKALFLAFLATRNQQLPYLKSRHTLAEKLLGLLSAHQQDDLVLLNQLLLFEGTNPHNPDLLDLSDLPHPMLEQLIQLLLKDRYLAVSVEEGGSTRSYAVYLLYLYRDKMIWQLETYNLEANKKQMIPVDNLVHVEPLPNKKRTALKKIVERLRKQEDACNLILDLGPLAIAQFKKYHPFKLSLAYTNPYQTTARLKTFVQVGVPDEVEAFTSWLLFLGKDIKIRELPEEVREALRARMDL
ncbi:HTH domain-containing protein [Paenibacillus sp. IB182496]|uniref:HTH domain-containing protein n=1 Tax=Paenibacillus sabuli TaxID=2772509 RepID=A0A927BTL2_9BACL|nr:HTH domain-containing protein [Paenibacillus sabuli]MBD2845440.1 HTH domain-containing protein [Paenibacillus sabuli]